MLLAELHLAVLILAKGYFHGVGMVLLRAFAGVLLQVLLVEL